MMVVHRVIWGVLIVLKNPCQHPSSCVSIHVYQALRICVRWRVGQRGMQKAPRHTGVLSSSGIPFLWLVVSAIEVSEGEETPLAFAG